MRELMGLMTQSVTVYRYAGVNEYGEREWGRTAEVLPCRIDASPKLVRATGVGGGKEGTREVVSSARVYLLDRQVALQDKLILPDGTAPVILAVSRSQAVGGEWVVEVAV